MEQKLKKVLFITNIPAPYRIDFYNELGKHCELTVIFEATVPLTSSPTILEPLNVHCPTERP